ncbi:hypothetical protein HDE_04363 [Halotydeus destructor]|nr:hypothetical protein HDE_04363 [Halotydeus destructor]
MTNQVTIQEIFQVLIKLIWLINEFVSQHQQSVVQDGRPISGTHSMPMPFVTHPPPRMLPSTPAPSLIPTGGDQALPSLESILGPLQKMAELDRMMTEQGVDQNAVLAQPMDIQQFSSMSGDPGGLLEKLLKPFTDNMDSMTTVVKPPPATGQARKQQPPPSGRKSMNSDPLRMRQDTPSSQSWGAKKNSPSVPSKTVRQGTPSDSFRMPQGTPSEPDWFTMTGVPDDAENFQYSKFRQA